MSVAQWSNEVPQTTLIKKLFNIEPLFTKKNYIDEIPYSSVSMYFYHLMAIEKVMFNRKIVLRVPEEIINGRPFEIVIIISLSVNIVISKQ